MRRLDFRRVLPLLFVAVHIALIGSLARPGMPHVSPPLRDMGPRAAATLAGKGTASAVPQATPRTWASAPEVPDRVAIPVARSRMRPPYQEGGGILTEPLYEPPPLKASQKIDILLNLPAIAPAEVIGAILFPQNETAWLYIAVPLILLLWYAVGRWIDGLLGYRPRMRLPRLSRSVLGIPASGMLLLSIAMLTPLDHHRNVNSNWVASGFIFWSALCLTIVFSSTEADRIHGPKPG